MIISIPNAYYLRWPFMTLLATTSSAAAGLFHFSSTSWEHHFTIVPFPEGGNGQDPCIGFPRSSTEMHTEQLAGICNMRNEADAEGSWEIYRSYDSLFSQLRQSREPPL